MLLLCFVLVGFVLNTAVRIWKGWIIQKWSDLVKGMETPEVFILSADADTKPWILSTLENQVHIYDRYLGPNFHLTFLKRIWVRVLRSRIIVRSLYCLSALYNRVAWDIFCRCTYSLYSQSKPKYSDHTILKNVALLFEWV